MMLIPNIDQASGSLPRNGRLSNRIAHANWWPASWCCVDAVRFVDNRIAVQLAPPEDQGCSSRNIQGRARTEHRRLLSRSRSVCAGRALGWHYARSVRSLSGSSEDSSEPPDNLSQIAQLCSSCAGATFGMPSIRDAGMRSMSSSTVNSPLFSYL